MCLNGKRVQKVQEKVQKVQKKVQRRCVSSESSESAESSEKSSGNMCLKGKAVQKVQKKVETVKKNSSESCRRKIVFCSTRLKQNNSNTFQKKKKLDPPKNYRLSRIKISDDQMNEWLFEKMKHVGRKNLYEHSKINKILKTQQPIIYIYIFKYGSYL